MGLRYLTADWVYPVSSPRVHHGVVVMDGDRVIEVTTQQNINAEQQEYHQGIITPGFINTHCHLELSHLRGKAPTGTGLLPFLNHVVKFRNVDPIIIDQAIKDADAAMWELGIQAVGDICNKTDTFQVKLESKIQYYNFVEMFDFQQHQQTDHMIKAYMDAYIQAPEPKSAVPHAPYSVSPTLFERINQLNGADVTVSIHNQETPDEEDFFKYGKGGFFDFFNNFGFDLSHFQPTGSSSIYYALEHMDREKRTLFVHNTLTTPADIFAAQSWNERVYWATCPNANLYIENQLPHYQYFIDTGARLTIGTDSLTSNWQLSVLEEMKTISKYQSYVPFETILQWATINGAMALGMEDEMGSFDKGKRPGVLLISFDPEKDQLFNPHVAINRLI
ncbi:MAG: amidohydrolase family protein [Saprospiraceae bacterium]|nr:amidohydrolase family protein [Saprospiraceae bacterium]